MSAIQDALLAGEIASALGPLTLRRETADDAQFRFTLFRDSRPQFALLPEPVRTQILRQQFAAQADGYGRLYPGALSAIVEADGMAVGRLVLHEGPGRLELVDIAMAGNVRGKGAGAALMGALKALAERAGRPLHLRVSAANPAAERFYLRLGLREVARTDADRELAWP
ncbi:MAG TPA: GNAT family N-acetyltransferase [Rhizomicrobium sp.]|nr:GNAT family N-acetyltransferase [Rhizomicrobium sp.]